MKKKIISLLITTLILSFVFVGCGSVSTDENSNDLKNSSNISNVKELYNSDVYEFIDPDTGVHYLIYSQKAGYSGMGGITPRLNSDGTIMVD